VTLELHNDQTTYQFGVNIGEVGPNSKSSDDKHKPKRQGAEEVEKDGEGTPSERLKVAEVMPEEGNKGETGEASEEQEDTSASDHESRPDAADLPQPICWIDASTKGSIFRFMVHSCRPNVQVIQARVGTHNRILGVQTVRAILPGGLITIDYGPEWFQRVVTRNTTAVRRNIGLTRTTIAAVGTKPRKFLVFCSLSNI
jgi:hypothetical protein